MWVVAGNSSSLRALFFAEFRQILTTVRAPHSQRVLVGPHRSVYQLTFRPARTDRRGVRTAGRQLRGLAMIRSVTSASLALSLGLLVGCASSTPRLGRPAVDALGSGSLVGQFRAFDGRTGREITLTQAANIARRADVVLFGEEHNDFVCNQIEAQLLAALAADRPTSLAMEFFETDTQAALDAYLDGKLDESDFRKAARQGKAYSRSHRPLIEICREMNLPVIAANTPRELVRRFRQSGLEYPEFVAALSPEERVLVPARFSLPLGAYFDRFKDAMGGHGAPPTVTAPAPKPEPQPDSESAVEMSTLADRPPSSEPALTPIEESTEATPPGQPEEGSGSANAASTHSAAEEEEDPDETGERPATVQADSSGDTTVAPEPVTQPASPESEVPSDDKAATRTAEGEPSSQAASAPAHPKLSQEEMVLSMFKAQSLWDDAMAESIANHRKRFADRRVMLVVGVFHVRDDGGTELKLRERRPRDRVVTVAYRGVGDLTTGFDPDDRGAAEIVIYGLKTE